MTSAPLVVAKDHRTMIVVIINFNTAEMVRACLHSLDLSRCRVVIVDNGSTDSDRQILRGFLAEQFPRAHLIESETNLGFGGAFNWALRLLVVDDLDPIWLLNPDTIVDHAAVDNLLAALKAAPRHAILSPLVLQAPLGSDRIWFGGGDLDFIRGKSNHWHMGEPTATVGEDAFAVSFISGAAPLALAGTWKWLEGFRSELFLYWEDAELSKRASLKGAQLLMIPTARVWHLEGGATRGTDPGKSSTYYYYYARNRVIVCGGTALPRRLDVLVGRGAFTTLRQLALIMVRERHRRLVKLRSFCKGSIDGLRGTLGPRKL